MCKLAQSDFLLEAADFDADRLFTLPFTDLIADLDLLRRLLQLLGVICLLLYY